MCAAAQVTWPLSRAVSLSHPAPQPAGRARRGCSLHYSRTALSASFLHFVKQGGGVRALAGCGMTLAPILSASWGARGLPLLPPLLVTSSRSSTACEAALALPASVYAFMHCRQ